MILSAGESLLALLISCFILFRVRFKVFKYLNNPVILFCLVFALIFAFGVGVSTYNFGTLARYKIPLLPYYFTMLGMIYYFEKSDKKAKELASTE